MEVPNPGWMSSPKHTFAFERVGVRVPAASTPRLGFFFVFDEPWILEAAPLGKGLAWRRQRKE